MFRGEREDVTFSSARKAVVTIIPNKYFSPTVNMNNALLTSITDTARNVTKCPLIDKNGYHRIEWMMTYFGTCARSPLEQASFWIGLLSIGFWLCANTPYIQRIF